jgi:hypothetical protein
MRAPALRACRDRCLPCDRTRLRLLSLAVLATLALATPAEAAKSVKGKWKGTVHRGDISFPVKMTITRTRVGSTGGTLSNVKRRGAKLRWRATAPSGQVGKALLRRA